MAKFVQGIWDWSPLNGIFLKSSKIRVGDLDGWVECYGKLLFFEGKPLSFILDKGNGQTIGWRTIANHGITLFILYYRPEDLSEENPTIKNPIRMQVWRPFSPEPDEIIDASWQVIIDKCLIWEKWAQSQKEKKNAQS